MKGIDGCPRCGGRGWLVAIVTGEQKDCAICEWARGLIREERERLVGVAQKAGDEYEEGECYPLSVAAEYCTDAIVTALRERGDR